MAVFVFIAALAVLAAEDPGLSLANPIVLGPIAGFIFAVFVYEVIVPGKTFRREQEENARLRELVETVIPLTAKLVEVCEQNTELITRNTEAFHEVTALLRTRDQ
ncbi:hypothetical protein [Nonomuraea sp. SYSU D8015]|uniref:hypothetical protein n=1 Tax=Nonomuraea sp. SYSU D8015 TaxID=2593644 RepID=UPI00166186DD|nr:hypothetical protein [Nonomuraea sp. SYSU D8015]